MHFYERRHICDGRSRPTKQIPANDLQLPVLWPVPRRSRNLGSQKNVSRTSRMKLRPSCRSDEPDESAADHDADPEGKREAAREPHLDRRGAGAVPPPDAPTCQIFEHEHVEARE